MKCVRNFAEGLSWHLRARLPDGRHLPSLPVNSLQASQLLTSLWPQYPDFSNLLLRPGEALLLVLQTGSIWTSSRKSYHIPLPTSSHSPEDTLGRILSPLSISPGKAFASLGSMLQP